MPPPARKIATLVGVLFLTLMLSAPVSPVAAQVAQVSGKSVPSLPQDPAAVIAVVGQSPILLGDVLQKADARIQQVVAKTGQQIPEEQLRVARVNLVRGALAEAIQNKMMRESYLLDQVGTQAADKRAEADAMLSQRARQIFFESELPELKKQYQVEDLTELDKRLREKGNTLAGRQRDFVDAMLGHLYIRSKVSDEPSVSIAEITEYYDENKSAEFHHATRARWEQLTALFSEFPTRDAAYQAIWKMGNEAYFGGNMQAVAKAKSQEPLASSGGLHPWTDQGALASEPLDQAIFSIELNAMSEIIEDDRGFHIVRVLEREQAGYQALADVQDEVRALLRKQKIVKARRKALDDLRDRIPVWSWFPDDVPGAKPMPARASQ